VTISVRVYGGSRRIIAEESGFEFLKFQKKETFFGEGTFFFEFIKKTRLPIASSLVCPFFTIAAIITVNGYL
jgi:hypothetical protein